MNNLHQLGWSRVIVDYLPGRNQPHSMIYWSSISGGIPI